jgi:hypothetical protein
VREHPAAQQEEEIDGQIAASQQDPAEEFLAVPLHDHQCRDAAQAGEGNELLGGAGFGHGGSFAAAP